MRKPFWWKQDLITVACKSAINKDNHSPIAFGANNPACRLQHFIHPWKHICVMITVHLIIAEILTDQIPLKTDLRNSSADNKYPDTTIILQVNPFREHPPHYTKTNGCFQG